MDERNEPADIHHLVTYYPRWSPQHDDASRLLVDALAGGLPAVRHFARKLRHHLPEHAVLTALPPKTPGHSCPGADALIAELCRHGSHSDGRPLLIRRCRVSGFGCREARSYERHVRSLAVTNPSVIVGRVVVVVQMLCRSAVPLQAAIARLREAGAAAVYPRCVGARPHGSAGDDSLLLPAVTESQREGAPGQAAIRTVSIRLRGVQ
ncbi:hypothetical protein [Halorhodospira halophila]|uniref:hypothetical protein n=1 Tax=Halorhodospira halophila TaxID=1053 RepID=UPI001913BB83|nr:hypothetical protein [Halorhodospira halophila]MBK5936085.1 hypothetical protein [Halorhodospira halophila]